MRKIHNLFIAAVVAAVISGCETADDEFSGVSTLSSSSSQGEAAPAEAQQQVATPVATTASKTQTAAANESAAEPTPQPTASNTSGGVATVPDAVPFGALSWKYGGLSASGAKQTAATIRGLRISGQNLSYSWGGATLASWGLADKAAGAYACLFVQNASGAWVGGKFDWISTSRTTRDLKNIFVEKYGGWNLSDVPNPCSAAFVIVSADKKKRTNVLLTTWKR